MVTQKKGKGTHGQKGNTRSHEPKKLYIQGQKKGGKNGNKPCAKKRDPKGAQKRMLAVRNYIVYNTQVEGTARAAEKKRSILRSPARADAKASKRGAISASKNRTGP